MKKLCMILLCFIMIISLTACNNPKQQPDEYYIQKIKSTYFKKNYITKYRNINCNVNSYSETQVKVTCSYESYLCISTRDSLGYNMCGYKDWVPKTVSQIYDIEYIE